MDKEAVNHPAHYGGESDPFEHVKVAEAKGWDRDAMVYNATKYLWRFNLKADGAKAAEDLKKAVWYLQRRIASLQPPASVVSNEPERTVTLSPQLAKDIMLADRRRAQQRKIRTRRSR